MKNDVKRVAAPPLDDLPALVARASRSAATIADKVRDDPANRFQGMPSDGASRECYEALGEQAWIGLHWPTRLGGGGLSALHTAAVEECLGYEWLPLSEYLLGVKTIGNAMLRYADDDLLSRLLPEIAAGRLIFCQGFSEPEAGTDLARLRTRAVKVDGGYRVTGHKIWTSSAYISDWIYLAVRTDPDAQSPHRGLSVLVCDLRTPGITVRPFPTLGGGKLAEVWLEDVFVPEDQLVGPENGGWTVLMGTMDYERVTSEKVGVLARLVDELAPLVESKEHRAELRRIQGETDAARELGREATLLLMNEEPASAVAAMCKLSMALLCQRVARFGMDVLGTEALVDAGVHESTAGKIAALRRAAVGSTIAGGSAEVQRRLIARFGLGFAAR